MSKLKPLACLLAVLWLSACVDSATRKRANDEREGARELVSARVLYRQHSYDAARDSIMALRTLHPLAIEARKQGILLLDSIELSAASDSLEALQTTGALGDSVSFDDEQERLSVKVQFFTRKLKEDLAKR